jgi:hypothetical protein
MFTVNFKAPEASSTAASFAARKAAEEQKRFEDAVQKALDEISEKIQKQSERGSFSIEVEYFHTPPIDIEEDDYVITFNEKGVNEIIRALREAGYNAEEKRYGNNRYFNIIWDDPEDLTK